MTVESILRLVADELEARSIPYMLTGSLAGSYHGVPRATQDVDLVVDADREALLELARALRRSGLYVSDDAVEEAVEARGMFNVIDPDSGWKVDFILRKDRPFSRTEFERRESARVLGLELCVVRAEDVLVAKLEWAKKGAPERHLRDAAGIIAVQRERLDRVYIDRWVAELDVGSEWARALEMVESDT